MPSMFCLSRFCTTCLQNKTNLIEIKKSNDINSINWKLTLCVNDEDWSFVKKFYMCAACIQLVELSFNFRETCKKSAETLRNYIETLSKPEDQDVTTRLEGNISIPLKKEEVPKEYVDEFNTRQVPNVILPNNVYSFLQYNPQFPIINIIPNSTVVPMVPGQTFINQVPPLMLINSLPTKPPPPDSTTQEVNEILNNTASEEVSISIDPMEFNFNNEEENLLDVVKEEVEEDLEIPYKKGQSFCHNCKKEFETRRALKIHRWQNPDCFATRRIYFRKGSKTAQCHICNRKVCTPQYLQHHLELHEKNGTTGLKVGRRKVQNMKQIKNLPLGDRKRRGRPRKIHKHNKDDSDNESLEGMCIEPEITISVGLHNFEKNPLEENINEDKNPLSTNKDEKINKENALGLDEENTSTLVNINEKNPLPLTHTKKKRRRKQKLTAVNEEPSVVIEDENPLNINKDKKPLSINGDENPLSINEGENSLIINENGNPLSISDDENPLSINEDDPLTIPDGDLIVIEDDENHREGLLNGLRFKMVDGKACCGYCGKLFDTQDGLQHHIGAIHQEKMHFKCQFCKKKFFNCHRLKIHLPEHYNYFICMSCNKSFTSVPEIHGHMFSKHQKFASTKCVSCAIDFESVEALTEHGRLHLENMVFVCHICDERFKDNEDFTAHMVQHYKLYTCHHCQIQFCDESEFLTHYESHAKVT